ncbi:hypothetical protein [Thalassococcus lentus]|uniref:Uncharacterized protein n=1 Tax=Thalassococcus lentus TaxID=1210524 RepID=A0ABT4XV84_9RHOB|nr:hypothetical protein [Thalassococcus lentus]MDA7425872.1 hypothetical protein [Thalassococcus lentus]
MLDIILLVIATAMGGGAGSGQADAAAAEAPPVSGGVPSEAAAPSAQERARQAYTAEPQVATGKFTTALEVKPILTATKGNWVAVRDWQGQDLIYLSHLLAWRCGLAAAHVGINGEPPEAWDLPPCLVDTAQPNAIPDDAVIYKAFPPGSIQTITVELTYDDLSTDSAFFERKAVLLP